MVFQLNPSTDVRSCSEAPVKTTTPRIALLAVGLLGVLEIPSAAAANAEAAQALATDSKCFKCHGLEKKKDGPAFRDVAAKFGGTAEAESKLMYHLTSGEKVKFPDGHEESHKKVKTTDLAQTKNLIAWILSLPGGTRY